MTSGAAIGKLLAFTSLCVLSVSSAGAKDLKPISDFLRPAYSAMNLALLCAQDDPAFLSESSGPRGNAINYAEHVRSETILSLSSNDAAEVIRLAADEARSDARNELRKVVPTQTYRYPQIAAWCRGYVLDFVRSVIRAHDDDHAALVLRLDNEKQKLKLGK